MSNNGEKLFMYHMYKSGRWYDIDVKNNNNYELNDDEKYLRYKVESYEREYTGEIIENVNIDIYFSDTGYIKIKDLFN